MKKVLLLMVAVLMVSSVAMADHLGIYSDGTGASCNLGAPGFYSTPVIMHKFSAGGTTGVRFKMTPPPNATIFAFNTGFAPLGVLTSDMSVGYQACLNGSFVVGTIVGQFNSPGELKIEVADLQTYIQMTNCLFEELPITGGSAYIGMEGDCHEVATEQSTWGKVKSLYR